MNLSKLVTIFSVSCLIVNFSTFAHADDPAEVTIGERLFLETRFAQHFAVFSEGDANKVLDVSDPVVDDTKTVTGSIPGPFKGLSMNCRACHLVDEQQGVVGGGNRTYGDFARRSPIPEREDGQTVTPRNSPPLVNASIARTNKTLFHFDGQFSTVNELARETYTGRNFGWLPTEHGQAVRHVAHIIRDDNGNGDLAKDYASLPYKVLLKGTDPKIPADFRLPEKYRVDVSQLSDTQVLNAIDALVAEYVKSLAFRKNALNQYNGSPYDRFLHLNQLPAKPDKGESTQAYNLRLLNLVQKLPDPKFVEAGAKSFALHEQPFAFGEQELAGLKIFLTQPKTLPLSAASIAKGKIGNCSSCHLAPDFTDSSVHNTGAAQDEYDSIHGDGAFRSIPIPSFTEREKQFNAYLPATPQHPYATGMFLSAPALNKLNYTDLGVWNVALNPDFPASQSALKQELCGKLPCARPQLLRKAIGTFKTPGLRDLADSQPYLHTGQKDTLDDVIAFYRNSSMLKRKVQLRNGDARLAGVALTENDVAPLVRFLKSLTEDYN